ncbi:MAG: amino acid racemase [Desulfobacula sp.]|nr:amino acid racemase [Desulfobacula sp.]
MMADTREKTVGIIGGMGPEATVDLMQRIIRLTPALDDRDHIHCLVDNNPKIPSRIKAIIEGKGEDPGPCMAGMAQGLEAAGADFLAIACNTAHVYYDIVCAAVRIPVIHMVKAVLDHLTEFHPGCSGIGILASPAIRITGLYDNILGPAGIRMIYPDPEEQKGLFQVIRQVKAGDLGSGVQEQYDRVCGHLKKKGADLAVVACTELSILGREKAPAVLDAAEVLAKRIVDVAKGIKSI